MAGATPTSPRLRAAVIGHTGAGDYGHGYDLIFSNVDGVVVVAVADPNEEGRRRAQERSRALRAYADYQEMLMQERPEIVAITPRHPAAHREQALAALESGAHLFLEKPMAANLPEADAIVKAADDRKRRVVVAHNRRYSADFLRAASLIREGFLGKIREVRMQGKQDARAGGEDLMVLGTHDFDFLRHCFGDPEWCFGVVTQSGRRVTPTDARMGREPIRVAGDSVRALFGFAGGLTATWTSVTTGDAWNKPQGPVEHWAFEVLGTQRILGYQSGLGFGYLDSSAGLGRGDLIWAPLPPPREASKELPAMTMGQDLFRAITDGTEPRCSALDGRWAIEMVTAVYQSHFSSRAVAFPLEDRRDPLA